MRSDANRHSRTRRVSGQKSADIDRSKSDSGRTTWAKASPKYFVSETEHFITETPLSLHHFSMLSAEHPGWTFPT